MLKFSYKNAKHMGYKLPKRDRKPYFIVANVQRSTMTKMGQIKNYVYSVTKPRR